MAKMLNAFISADDWSDASVQSLKHDFDELMRVVKLSNLERLSLTQEMLAEATDPDRKLAIIKIRQPLGI